MIKNDEKVVRKPKGKGNSNARGHAQITRKSEI
jgi:hypothetical protein